MKAKITNSDFRYKGKMIKEGETADFPKEEIEANPEILIPVAEGKSSGVSAKAGKSSATKSKKKK